MKFKKFVKFIKTLFKNGQKVAAPLIEKKRIAVLGSGSCQPGGEVYQTAYEVGKLLGGHNWEVVTGGYGGVMEAAAKGAIDVGGRARGYTMTVKPEGNPYAKIIPVEGFFARMEMLAAADAYVFLPGDSGTAAELMTFIHYQWLQVKFSLTTTPKPIFIVQIERWTQADELLHHLQFFLKWEQIDEMVFLRSGEIEQIATKLIARLIF